MEIEDEAIFKIAELIAYAMVHQPLPPGRRAVQGVLFRHAFTLTLSQYLYFGLHGHNALVPWIWIATVFNICALFLCSSPEDEENFVSLNVACILMIIGIYIEKGHGPDHTGIRARCARRNL
ncbi:MAG: hypothetical protein MZU95_03865 [Desulfomicrobium escambiense]|nr:hypothetical protein [Desulfomicrobium escambiense]